MDFKNFFQELKKRKVYQVGIVYAVTTWLLAQVASLATTSFEAPSWVMKMVIIFLLIGFPIALILAWAFELTPDGIVKTDSTKEDNEEGEKTTSRRSKRFTRYWAVSWAYFYLAYCILISEQEGRQARLLPVYLVTTPLNRLLFFLLIATAHRKKTNFLLKR